MAFVIKRSKRKERPYMYPFVEKPATKKELERYTEYKLFKKTKEGKELTRKEKDALFDYIRGSSIHTKKGIALQGWILNFEPVLKRFMIKFKGDNMVYEYYAPDKMSIRNNRYMSGIDEIMEVPKKKVK